MVINCRYNGQVGESENLALYFRLTIIFLQKVYVSSAKLNEFDDIPFTSFTKAYDDASRTIVAIV